MRHTKFEMAFPCEFPLKIIGWAASDFEQTALAVVNKHVPELNKNAVHTAKSKGGKYLSMTVKFQAQNQTQLDQLYQDLTAHPQILMAL